MPSQTPSQYFSPTYFSPYYFPPLVVSSTNGTGTDSVPVFRDRDAFVAIVNALNNTGEFANVIFGTSPDRLLQGADSSPLAVVSPDSWIEYDDVDPIMLVRQVTWNLTIIVRNESSIERYDRLDLLSCIVMNQIDGMDLGGACVPDLTKLRAGRYDLLAKHPEERLTMNGEFSYLIPSFSGHSTEP